MLQKYIIYDKIGDKKLNMQEIPYYHELVQTNRTYSIDMITIKAKIRHDKMERVLSYLDNRICMQGNDGKHIMTAPNRYHYFYSFMYDVEMVGLTIKPKCTVTYEVGQNNFNGTIKDNIKIRFNPNKVLGKYNGENEKAKTDLATIYDFLEDIKVDQIDLAIDIPVTRGCVTTKPFSKRAYRRYNGEKCRVNDDGIATTNADDYTQYVGKHNTHGFLKIYNKTEECKLSYPCTRVELTIEPSKLKDAFRWTPVLVMDNEVQMKIKDTVSEDDLILSELLSTCQDPMSYISRLSKYRKKIIEALVFDGYKELAIDVNAVWFKYILDEIQTYVNGDVVKDFKKYQFRSVREEYRLYSRRKFISKFYINDNVNGKNKRFYVVDMTEEQLLRLSNDVFNEGVKYFLGLYDLNDELRNYKPYTIGFDDNNTKNVNMSVSDGFIDILETDIDIRDVFNE